MSWAWIIGIITLIFIFTLWGQDEDLEPVDFFDEVDKAIERDKEREARFKAIREADRKKVGLDT